MKRQNKFRVHGPFPVPVEKRLGIVDDDHLNKSFWSTEGTLEELATSRGCYVFAIRAGKGYTPCYIGQATKGFARECFQPHKLLKFGKALLSRQKGTPVMFFVVHPPVKQGRINGTEIDDIESYLINLGATHNPRLLNERGREAPTWSIDGVVRAGRGKPSHEAREFKKLFGLNGHQHIAHH